MPSFRFKVVTGEGEVVEGCLEAASKAAAVAHFRDQGQVPVRIEPAAARPWRRAAAPALGPRDLTLATRQLAILVEAGLPLDRALAFAAEAAPSPRARAAMARARERLAAGKSLADAMAADGASFPAFYVAMVRAGEAGGALAAVTGRLADFLERSEAMRQQVRTAMVYPAILMLTAVVILTLMVTVVLPQFEPMFAEAGDRLPLATRMVVAGAAAARASFWLVPPVLALAVWAGMRAWAEPGWRRRADHAVLRLPLVGGLVRMVQAARFCRTLSALLANGVGHLAALGIVGDVLTNAALRERLAAVTADLKGGQGIAAPLARLDVLPPLALQLVRLGEETGRLDAMLAKAADLLDQEVQAGLTRLIGLLTPVMTVVLGAGVGGIIAAILSAMLSVYELPL